MNVTAEVISSMQVLSLGPALEPHGWQALQSTDAWILLPNILIDAVWGATWALRFVKTLQKILTCSQI